MHVVKHCTLRLAADCCGHVTGSRLIPEAAGTVPMPYAIRRICDVAATGYPSTRSAIAGSMRVLDRAGMNVASDATASSDPATATSVTASVGVTS